MNQITVDNRIQPGDRVTIHFSTSPSLHDAEVLGRPADTGDTWKLRSMAGELVEVQSFERIDRLTPLWESDCPECKTAIRYRDRGDKVVCLSCGHRFPMPPEADRRVPF